MLHLGNELSEAFSRRGEACLYVGDGQLLTGRQVSQSPEVYGLANEDLHSVWGTAVVDERAFAVQPQACNIV